MSSFFANELLDDLVLALDVSKVFGNVECQRQWDDEESHNSVQDVHSPSYLGKQRIVIFVLTDSDDGRGLVEIASIATKLTAFLCLIVQELSSHEEMSTQVALHPTRCLSQQRSSRNSGRRRRLFS